MLKELFPGSTDFTVAVFKIPQISKHFSAMLSLTSLANDFQTAFWAHRPHGQTSEVTLLIFKNLRI